MKAGFLGWLHVMLHDSPRSLRSIHDQVSMVWFHGLRCCNNMGMVTKQHEKNLRSKSDIVNKKMSSWWFQPSWKILVKLDHFRKYGGKLNNNLKPPPRCEFCSTEALNMSEQTKSWYSLRSQLLNDMIFLTEICTKDGWRQKKQYSTPNRWIGGDESHG